MTKDHDERKCAFGVFLDIVDSFQEIHRKATSERQTLGVEPTYCPLCSKEMPFGAKDCCSCGTQQPNQSPHP